MTEFDRFIMWLCQGFTYVCIAMIVIASLSIPMVLFGFISPQ
jgi:hypothetical protein